MDPGLVAIVGFCLFLLLWYGAAYLYNRRRGRQFHRWLLPGVGALGQSWRTTWWGSSLGGFHVAIADPVSPFKSVELILLLENREMVLFWLIDLLRGRRDWLILKASFDKARLGEVEVLPARSRLAQGFREQAEQGWKGKEGPHDLAIFHRGTAAQEQLAGLVSWLEEYGASLDRLSWRREAPHVQLQLRAAGLLDRSSERLLADLRGAIAGTA